MSDTGYIQLTDVVAAMRDLITKEVEFELSAKNLDRPGPGGIHTSEWYVAYGIHTGFNERLHRHLVDWLEAEDEQ